MSRTEAQTSEIALVLTTAPDRETAERIVRELVAERLIACGNLLGDVTSIYRWQGSVETTPELLVLLKTRPELVSSLFRRVAELHPYEVPELLLLPVAAASAYSQWVRDETTEVTV